MHVRLNHDNVPVLVLWQHGTQCAFLSLIKGVVTYNRCPYHAMELSYPQEPDSRQFSVRNVVADFKVAAQQTPHAHHALNHLEEYRTMATQQATPATPGAAPWPASLAAAAANGEDAPPATPARARKAAKAPAAPAAPPPKARKAAKAPVAAVAPPPKARKAAKAPVAPAPAAKKATKAAPPAPTGRTRETFAGKRIRVLNKNHGARADTYRQIAMDILCTSKTTDEAIERFAEWEGINNSFIRYAIDHGIVELY